MNNNDWRKIRAEYIQGGTSFRKLAAKYGVPFSTLKNHARDEKWTDLRRQSDEKANTKIIESAANRNADRAVTFDYAADALLYKLMNQCDVEGFLVEPKDYKAVASAIRDLREVKGVKTEADMREQEARINKLIKECESHDEDDNKEIKVILSNNLDEFAN